MRRDAQQRREAIIAAAAACFQESGYAVALEDVADRAGVGRGTLYRNFKDRMALVLAIFEREIDQLNVRVDPTLPLARTLADIVRDGAPAQFLFARLASEMPLIGDDMAAFRSLESRLEAVLEPAAAIARQRGEMPVDTGAPELALAVRMVGGLLHPGMAPAEVETSIERGVRLLLVGLCHGAAATPAESAGG